jgi:hypothetical protein
MTHRTWLACVGLLLLVAVGCGDTFTAPPTGPIVLSASDDASSITCSIGRKLDIVLQTIGPGEYQDPSLSSDAVEFLNQTLGPVNPAGPEQTFHFTCVKPGSADIRILHSSGNRTFRLAVQVQ